MTGLATIRILVGFTLTFSPVTGRATAQEPSADSLVAYWIQRGALAAWSPANLYAGCPNLMAWQRRGMELLFGSTLTAERTQDLAKSLMGTVGTCPDSRLERWYFDHLNSGMERLADEGELYSFWQGLRYGDSPAIRHYLRDLMLDQTRRSEYREAAGTSFFSRFRGPERLREYLSAFETGRMPEFVAIGQSTHLLEEDADLLLREVGERVRQNVHLAKQDAFLQVAQSSYRYASQPARRALADALEEGIRQAGMTRGERSFLEAHVELLRQPPK